jgi:hypothetical protein
MATKPLRAIVCEGKDDLAVFRALLIAGEARKKPPSGMPTAPRMERYETDRIEITLEHRDGKSMLVDLAYAAAAGTAGVRPDMVLVSFDPDLDPPGREFSFFERDFEARKQGQLRRNEAGQRVLRMSNRDVVLLPAPWRSSSASSFAGLPEEHCIERVLIEGIVASRPSSDPLTSWATDTTTKLHALVANKGYKRDFRIWTAGVDPDSESFVARLFQMHDTKGACLDAIRATQAAKALRALLDG